MKSPRLPLCRTLSLVATDGANVSRSLQIGQGLFSGGEFGNFDRKQWGVLLVLMQVSFFNEVDRREKQYGTVDGHQSDACTESLRSL
jgi:hypothetical protein